MYMFATVRNTKWPLFWQVRFLLMGIWLCVGVGPVQAQLDRPQRQIRTFVPPEQLVFFRADTSITAFFDRVNPLFKEVTGKSIVDPKTRPAPIKVDIEGLYFFDAFELVLEANNLTYRETPQYFIIEEKRQRRGSSDPGSTDSQVYGSATPRYGPAYGLR